VKILLDANALMMPAQFQIDIFDELRTLVGGFEPILLPGVIKELEGLSREQGRDGAAARCGLALVQRCALAESTEIKSSSVDEQIIEYAERFGCIVVTNDRHIRNALFSRGVDVISMRKQKKLELLRR
jgi:rRNA-processing protein FCF1